VAESLPGGVEPSLVIGIGASAGGVEALRAVVAQLPADLDAAVCVVLHLPASGKSLLAPILDRASPLPVAVAVDGERVIPGRVYVAPADHHLLVEQGRIVLSRGPKENGARPAVDPTLRALALACGPRAVGVILSGALGDGSAGAAAVLAAGGVVVVQDPSEAVVPSMPESALLAVGGRATVLAAHDIGAALAELADARRSVREDVAMLPQPRGPEEGPAPAPDGALTALTCPECGGPLWDSTQGDASGYRCRVGHVYSEDALVDAQADSVEAALWMAVEVLEERAELLRRVAPRHRETPRTRGRFEQGSADASRRARLVRRALASTPEGADEPAGGVE
jgi:two-component system, chemotaxis family, protein-glutamate methylesterase/glutaminase